VALALAAFACGDGDPETTAVVENIPWTTPESGEYELVEADRTEGSGTLTIESDGELVALRQSFSDDAGNSDSRVVLADPVTLDPRSMERIIVNADEETRTEIRASYTEDAAAFESVTAGEQVNQTRDREPNSYDSEQHLFIGRTIPFSEDYQANYRAMDAATTQTRVISIEVAGRETVEVPAGEFETWKVEFKHASSRTTAWYTVDPPHYLVKARVLDFDYLLKALPD
jgi:hypothetical protein